MFQKGDYIKFKEEFKHFAFYGHDVPRQVTCCDSAKVSYMCRGCSEVCSEVKFFELDSKRQPPKFKVGDSIRCLGIDDNEDRIVTSCSATEVEYDHYSPRTQSPQHNVAPVEDVELFQPTRKFKAGDDVVLIGAENECTRSVKRTILGYFPEDYGKVRYALEGGLYDTHTAPEFELDLREQPQPQQVDYSLKDAMITVGGVKVASLGVLDFKYNTDGQPGNMVNISSGRWDINCVVELAPPADVQTWEFSGELDYRQLRDDLKAGGFKWATVRDVSGGSDVYLLGPIKHLLDCYTHERVVKVCAGLWRLPNCSVTRFESVISEARALATSPKVHVEAHR